jgi:hypothetical protein
VQTAVTDREAGIPGHHTFEGKKQALSANSQTRIMGGADESSVMDRKTEQLGDLGK